MPVKRSFIGITLLTFYGGLLTKWNILFIPIHGKCLRCWHITNAMLSVNRMLQQYLNCLLNRVEFISVDAVDDYCPLMI